MQLALTQPLCILFPQSLKALISGNTSHYMRANSLILFVSLWWSAIQAEVSGGLFWRNEDAYGARWISCFWDLSEGMLQCTPKQTNAEAIFTDTYAAHYGCLIISDCISVLHRPTSKEDFYIIIHRPSLPIIVAPETSLDANICRLEHRRIFIPAACTTHCPLVSSPLPSDSPAVAGCFASAHGCSRKL